MNRFLLALSSLEETIPLLSLSLCFLMGCSVAIFPHFIYCLPLVFTLLSSKKKKVALLFLGAGVLFSTLLKPPSPSIPLEGKGVFLLHTAQPHHSPFVTSIALKGHFSYFQTKEAFYQNIPATIFVKKYPSSGGTKWFLHGRLENTVCKPAKYKVWKSLPRPLSLAHFRYVQKEKVRTFFHKNIANSSVAHFFSSLATGDIDNRLLAMEFRKVGLGHILAISGFHFALVAYLLQTVLRFFLSASWTNYILIFLLTLYFVFLGTTPSILRAFLMIFFHTVGKILQRPSTALNLFFLSLFLELLFDPSVITTIGFQLSFLATFAILVFYSPCDLFLQKLICQKTLFQVQKMTKLNQHGYLLSSTIRKGVSLNLAVLLLTLLPTLYTFKTFCFLSIPYNLLFPPLLALSLLLLPIGLILPFVQTVNMKFTAFLLHLIANPPELLNYKIFAHFLSFSTVIIFLTLASFLGLSSKKSLLSDKIF